MTNSRQSTVNSRQWSTAKVSSAPEITDYGLSTADFFFPTDYRLPTTGSLQGFSRTVDCGLSTVDFLL